MKLDELAKLAGVSRTTASYVVNGKAKEYRVSDRTIQRVQALIEQYDFKPNAMAASLRAGRSKAIGLVIPDFENTSYAKIANLLENRCRELGYQLLIACSNDKQHNEMDCAKHLLQRQVDSLIVSTCLPSNSDFYQQYQHIPVIGFDRRITVGAVHSVLSDDDTDAHQLAQNLLSKQEYNNILFLGALPDLTMSQERETGFRRAVNGNIGKVNFLYADAFKKEVAKEVFENWLAENSLPDAIFTTSLTLLQGVVEVLLTQHRNIPDHLVFATFGESELVQLLGNPIVCCVQDHENIVDSLLEIVMSDRKKKETSMARINRQIRHHHWHSVE